VEITKQTVCARLSPSTCWQCGAPPPSWLCVVRQRASLIVRFRTLQLHASSQHVVPPSPSNLCPSRGHRPRRKLGQRLPRSAWLSRSRMELSMTSSLGFGAVVMTFSSVVTVLGLLAPCRHHARHSDPVSKRVTSTQHMYRARWRVGHG